MSEPSAQNAAQTDPYTQQKTKGVPAWARDVSKAERKHIYTQGRRTHEGQPIARFVMVVWRNPDPNGQPQKVCQPYLPGAAKPGLKPLPPVPYHLLSLRESESSRRVYITAGEKDADALYDARLLATTNPFGEGNWTDDYSRELLRFDAICIIPDRDTTEPAATVAKKHAQIIIASLRRCGYRGQVRVLELPGLSGAPDDKDLSDWLDHHGDIKEFHRLADAEFAKTVGYEIEDITDIINDTVPPRQPDLVEGIIPVSAEHIELIGMDGTGKTMTLEILMIESAMGRTVWGHREVERPVRYIFLSDDSPRDVLRRREAAIIDYLKPTQAEIDLLRSNYLPIRDEGFLLKEPDKLRATLQRQQAEGKPVDVIVVDARTTAYPDNPNDPELATAIYRDKLEPVCREFGTRYLIIGYPTKKETDDAGNKIRATISGTQVHNRHADHIMVIKQTSNFPPEVSIYFDKVRDGSQKGTTVSYQATIEPVPEGTADDPFDTMVVWQPRGWVALTPVEGVEAKKAKKDKADFVADKLLPYLRERRSRADCQTYITSVLKIKAAEKTIDKALKTLVDERLAGKEPKGKETYFWALTDLTVVGDGQEAFSAKGAA